MDKKNLADNFTSGTTKVELINMAREVYAHLNDEISKKIFEARMMYAMTGDVSFITGLSAKYRTLSGDMERYVEKLQKGAHVIIYGAEGAAHYLAGRFKYFGVKVDAFVDPEGNKGPMDKMGIRIISTEELLANSAVYGEKTFVISYSKKAAAEEVKAMLMKKIGVSEENICHGIYDFRNCASQYFDYFDAKSGEIFVDCGCFDGGTCHRFIGWCGVKGYEKIYSFEADPANYPKCEKILRPVENCELFPYGIAKEREKVYFASREFETSAIISREEAESVNYEGVKTIETVSLDEILKDKKITFLKMDIEGAEYGALQGAEKLIRANRPRMAISIYHSPEDFITIPYLVLQMQPDYRIAFRHYAFDELETVMYAD